MKNYIQFINNNPNLKENKELLKIDYELGFNDLFEIYSPINSNINNEEFIIFPSQNFNLNLLELKTQKLIKELKGHKNHVTQVKYFSNKNKNNYLIDDIDIEEIIKKNEEEEQSEKNEKKEDNEQNKINKEISEKNENNKIYENKNNNDFSLKEINTINKNKNNINYEEFIISSDMSGFVFIWNINLSYDLQYKIETKYQNYIYSCLILFNINKFNFVITSTLGRFNNRIDFSRLYLLSNGKYFKNIYGTNHNNTTYIIPWYNIKNNELYLIEFCRYYISVNNILKEDVYHSFENKNSNYNKYYGGFIYTKNEKDYLVSCSYNGTVEIWDLFNKKLERFLKINKSRLYSITKWNTRYFIVGDYNKGEIIIIELELLKIITLIKNKNIKNIISLKKINHPLYKDSILILSNDGIINILSI